MRLLLAGLMAVVVSAAVGCQSNDPYRLGAARGVVAYSLQATGGLKTWQSVSRIHATAVVASYDRDGGAHVDRMRLTIEPWGNYISASGQSPQGNWSASLSDNGPISVFGQPSQARDTLRDTLASILHRTRGSLNLLDGSEKIASIDKASIAGEELTRVRVRGKNAQAAAYYFSTASKMLRYVTSGADEPGAKGTLTIFGQGKEPYVRLGNGLVFPKSFRIVQIGQYVLPSDQMVLDVDLADLRAE